MSEVFGEAGLKPEDIDELRHGTTVASNAILELKGAKVGLITSAGFKGHFRNSHIKDAGSLRSYMGKPPALVERYLRQVVDERISSNGVVERAPKRSDVEKVVDCLLEQNVEAIAVCLINSYANPEHEQLSPKSSPKRRLTCLCASARMFCLK